MPGMCSDGFVLLIFGPEWLDRRRKHFHYTRGTILGFFCRTGFNAVNLSKQSKSLAGSRPGMRITSMSKEEPLPRISAPLSTHWREVRVRFLPPLLALVALI